MEWKKWFSDARLWVQTQARERIKQFWSGLAGHVRWLIYISLGLLFVLAVFAAGNIITFSSIYSMWHSVCRSGGLTDALSGPVSFLLAFVTMAILPSAIGLFVLMAFGFRPWKLMMRVGAVGVPLLFVGYVIQRPHNGELFNPITGKAGYKYSKTDQGRIVLFDPGYNFDPSTGEQLKVIDKDAAKLYNAQKSQEASEQQIKKLQEQAAYDAIEMDKADFPVDFSSSPQWLKLPGEDCDLAVSGIKSENGTLTIRLIARQHRGSFVFTCGLPGPQQGPDELYTVDGTRYVLKNSLVTNYEHLDANHQPTGRTFYHLNEAETHNFLLSTQMMTLKNFKLNYQGAIFNVSFNPQHN